VYLFYKIILRAYYCIVWLVSHTNTKAKQWVEGRKETMRALDNFIHKDCIWFHTSSLGEFEQASFLIETMRKRYPQEKILVTFYSPSGYSVKKNFKFADSILYLPFDFKEPIKHFIDNIQPKLVFWIRYEFWLNTLQYLNEKKIPVILINGVFRPSIPFLYKAYLEKCLNCFSEITVISPSSQENLKMIGFQSTVIADSRYGRMHQVAQTFFEDRHIEHFIKGYKTVICGSIWANDDKILSDTIKRRDDIRWILVPHEIDTNRMNELQTLYPNAQKYSQFETSNSGNILIIDNVGLLAKIYRYADAAYVGGGFNKVVHSLIEPLAYKLPTIIGKNIEKSEEAINFLNLGFVNKIHDGNEFETTLTKLLTEDNSSKKGIKESYFKQKINSIDTILDIAKDHVAIG